MDSFGDFDITQEDLSQIENIEFDLLNPPIPRICLHLSSDEDDYIQPSRFNRCRVIPSDSEDSDAETNRTIQNLNETSPPSTWTDPKGNQRRVIAFTEYPGMKLNLRMAMINKFPADFYALLVTYDVLNNIVVCTNAYAINKMTLSNEASKAARIRDWFPTNLAEIKRFFGLVLYMGRVRLPKISDYWTNDKIIGQQFPRTIMSRNRLELLLRMLHFLQRDEENTTDRLHRVKDLLGVMNENFKKTYTPVQDLCIDESVVPFRGRLVFRQ